MGIKKIITSFLGAFSLALFCLACSAGQAFAEEYTLTWDPNSEPGVAGYKVHWGPQSRHYTFQKDVGRQTSCTVTNLQDDTVYFFAVTAYDSSGQESDYSVEVAAVPRYMLFGIDRSEQDGGWIEVLTPDYEHLHWLQTDWPEYNSQGGEMRVVTGDIDGDQLDELIIGFGPVAGVSQGRFWVLDHDYTHLAWGQVDWTEYNARNGETWPATGDLDGDGRDEILIGLGAGGEGRVYMFALLNGDLVSNGFFAVGWTEYRSLVGEVRPATGDLDGDGRDEIILGLGPTNTFSGLPGGRYQILDHDRTLLAWGQVEWPDYNALNGEIRPATGDLDGDGRAELLLGLGQGGGGMVQIVSLSQGKPEHRTWLNIGWNDYSSYNGETRPVAEDLDLDGLDEVLVGLGHGGLGRNLIFDDLENALAFQVALELWPEDYSSSYGGSWPSVQRRFESGAKNGLTEGPGDRSGGGEPKTLVRHLPHLTGDDMSWSDVLEVDNSGQTSARFTLTLYRGAATVFEDEFRVEANAYLAIALDALAPQATCGRVSFENPELTFRLAYENTQSEGLAGFLLDANPSFQLSFLFSNFSEMVAWKGLGLMNSGSEQAEITFSAYGEGKLLRQTTSSLAPLSKSVGFVENLFQGLTVNEVDRVQAVSSGSPIIGITITGSDDSDKLLFAPAQTTAALHPRAPSSTVNIPHLTGGDPNWVDMLEVDNPGSQPQNFTIFLYQDGQTVFQDSFEVSSYGYLSIPLKDLAYDATCGKVSFTSPDLKFRLAYEYGPSGGVAGFVLSDNAASQLSFLFSNFAATLDWKGLAVLNAHASPVTVDLAAYGEGGRLLGETEITVPGFSRSVGYVTDYFEGLGLESIEKVVASGAGAQLSGISITGSHWNDRMLFAPALQD